MRFSNIKLEINKKQGKKLYPFQNSYYTICPDVTYMFKVNNTNTKIMCEICSKLAIKNAKPNKDIFLYPKILEVLEKIFSLEIVKIDICLGGVSKQMPLFQKNVPPKNRTHAPNV